MKSATIMPKTKAEAKAIAGGLFRMNARFAIAYAFTQGKAPNYGVNLGEFMYRGEEITRDRWDAYIDLKTGKMVIV